MSDDLQTRIVAPPCPSCESGGFTVGAELFDPAVLPHLAALAALRTKHTCGTRVHFHRDIGNGEYFVEFLLRNSDEGSVILFDGPASADFEEAVQRGGRLLETLT